MNTVIIIVIQSLLIIAAAYALERMWARIKRQSEEINATANARDVYHADYLRLNVTQARRIDRALWMLVNVKSKRDARELRADEPWIDVTLHPTLARVLDAETNEQEAIELARLVLGHIKRRAQQPA